MRRRHRRTHPCPGAVCRNARRMDPLGNTADRSGCAATRAEVPDLKDTPSRCRGDARGIEARDVRRCGRRVVTGQSPGRCYCRRSATASLVARGDGTALVHELGEFDAALEAERRHEAAGIECPHADAAVAIRTQESIASGRDSHEGQSRPVRNGRDRFLAALRVPDSHRAVLVGGDGRDPAIRTLTIGAWCSSGAPTLSPRAASHNLRVPS